MRGTARLMRHLLAPPSTRGEEKFSADFKRLHNFAADNLQVISAAASEPVSASSTAQAQNISIFLQAGASAGASFWRRGC